jgi:aminopeptidase N
MPFIFLFILHLVYLLCLTFKVGTEIVEVFDTISYKKGSAIIQMLTSFVGEKAFREGLAHYLNTYQHKNTTPPNLWDSLQHNTTFPIQEIMECWTNQVAMSQPSFKCVLARISTSDCV